MTDYSEYIQAISKLNDTVADSRWLRGKLVCEMLTEHAAGGLTAGDIAAQTGVSPARLSEDKRNHEYYGNLRTSEEVSGLPYDMFTRARQRYPKDVELAMSLLAHAKTNAYTVAKLKQHIAGIEYEGPQKRHEAPLRVQNMLESDRLWVIYKKMEEDE
jgi:hypothetical protein